MWPWPFPDEVLSGVIGVRRLDGVAAAPPPTLGVELISAVVLFMFLLLELRSVSTTKNGMKTNL